MLCNNIQSWSEENLESFHFIQDHAKKLKNILEALIKDLTQNNQLQPPGNLDQIIQYEDFADNDVDEGFIGFDGNRAND